MTAETYGVNANKSEVIIF